MFLVKFVMGNIFTDKIDKSKISKRPREHFSTIHFSKIDFCSTFFYNLEDVCVFPRIRSFAEANILNVFQYFDVMTREISCTRPVSFAHNLSKLSANSVYNAYTYAHDY